MNNFDTRFVCEFQQLLFDERFLHQISYSANNAKIWIAPITTTPPLVYLHVASEPIHLSRVLEKEENVFTLTFMISPLCVYPYCAIHKY